MGLNSTISFAPGTSGAAAASFEKPSGGVFVSSDANNETLYTVPSGKYFKGDIIHRSYNYPPKLNNIDLYRYINIDENSDSYNNYMSHEFRLYAGDVIKSGASGGGSGGVKVQGCEFDL